MTRQKHYTDEERKVAQYAAHKRWREKNKEYLKEKQKEWHQLPRIKERYADHQRRWRQENPERSKEIDNLSYTKTKQHNQVSRMLSAAKARAKLGGLEFNITHEDIVIPEYCPILTDIKLERHSHRTRPELDRRDNSLGYVKGNVLVISGRANRLKSDASVAELKAILAYCCP